MTKAVETALGLWGLLGARSSLVAARENAVYKVTTQGAYFALRLHRSGYRSDAELRSELQWMDVAARAGLSVPAPLASREGAFLHVIGDVQVDVLSWLSGPPLAECIDQMDGAGRVQVFTQLGQAMAELHLASDAVNFPAGFQRCRWDVEGLLGKQPLWDRFWDNPGLTGAQRDRLLAFRDRARRDLDAHSDTLDFGLIHADLVPNNVLIAEDGISLIDFDDGGFGYRLFDVATVLLKISGRADFLALKEALIQGYHARRSLDMTGLDLLMAIRAATYVGWNITRMAENGGTERNGRFISNCLIWITAYLAQP